MPQFYPEHTPAGLDAFTTGYLACAEWLLDEDVNRDKVRGFTRAAIKQVKNDCANFQKTMAAELARYTEVTERDMGYAGHDFWLTRNHHGTGFWDRGNNPVLEELTKAAQGYGESYSHVYRGWIYLD